MVVPGSVGATVEKTAGKEAAGKGFTLHNEDVAFNPNFYTHLLEHFEHSGGTVRFLAGKAAETTQARFARAEGSKNGSYGEDVGSVVKVEGEALQRSTTYAYGAVFQLGDHGTSLYQHIYDGYVGLNRLHVKTFQLGAAENGTGYEEGCRCAPVALEVDVRRLEALAATHLEGDAGASTPVFIFKQLCVALHLAAGGNAEVAEHIERNVHVRKALGRGDVEGAVFGAEGQGHEEAGD